VPQSQRRSELNLILPVHERKGSCCDSLLNLSVQLVVFVKVGELGALFGCFSLLHAELFHDQSFSPIFRWRPRDEQCEGVDAHLLKQLFVFHFDQEPNFFNQLLVRANLGQGRARITGQVRLVSGAGATSRVLCARKQNRAYQQSEHALANVPVCVLQVLDNLLGERQWFTAAN